MGWTCPECQATGTTSAGYTKHKKAHQAQRRRDEDVNAALTATIEMHKSMTIHSVMLEAYIPIGLRREVEEHRVQDGYEGPIPFLG